MPIDFTAYTDPGVYIDLIDPPVNNTTSVTPTVIALVGTAGEEGRQISESTILRDSQYSSTLSAKGIDAFSLTVKNRFTLEQYTSAAIGTVRTTVSSGAGTVVIDKKEGFTLPAVIANADLDTSTEKYKINIDNQTYTVTGVTSDTNGYSFAISPTTTGVIDASSVVNLVAPYVTPVKVGTFDADDLSSQPTLTSSTTDFRILQYPKAVQRVRVTKASVSGSTDLKVSFDVSGSTYDFSNKDLIVDGAYKTAKEVFDSLPTALKSYVFVTRSEDSTNVDYVFYFGVDNPALLTKIDSGSVASIAALGVSAGDFLQFDQERVVVESVASVSTSGDTEIIAVTVTRGIDGTAAVAHGKVNVYMTSGYDYFVTLDSGDDTQVGSADDLTVLSSVLGGRLSPLDSNDNAMVSAETVEVRGYSTDAKQYAVEVFNDLDDIRDKYGKPLSSSDSPTILSNLTLAAQLALRNGANRVYCVSVASPFDVEAFEEAIDKLAGIDEINLIVPITAGLNEADNEQVISKVVDFCSTQSNLGNLIRAFVAVDGNVASVDADYFKSLAQRITNSRISLIAPSRFTIRTSTGKVSAGGPFAAAALAGLHASLEAQVPLTRKQLELSLYAVEDSFTGREMLDLQSKGVLVLFQDNSGRIVVRHGLTTDMTSLYSQEISVVAARDRLRDLIYNSLQSARILGSPITSNTPELVVANVTGALETAKRSTLIFDYADVKYRVPSNNPTAIEVRFAYRPTMPLNYVLVQFSVDTTSSLVTFQTINEGGA